jgi:hypothetical protein
MRRNFTTYPQTIDTQKLTPQPVESERAHLFTAAAGVLLPMLQAVITGCLAGLAAWLYAWLMKSPEAWKWGAGVAVGVAVLAWLSMLARWLNLTAPIERITRKDINRDGFIGAPPVVRVEVKSENGRQTQFAELPTSKEKMTDFARGVLDGTPISEARWSGAGALFSKSEFRAIRDLFIARGWARWVNSEFHEQGVELAPSGRAVMRQFAGETAAPSPTLPRE